MNKQKLIGAILGIVLFIAMIAGITYAATEWASSDIERTVSSKCFEVFYDKGTDLVGTIIPSNDYTGGLFATVKMNINTECDINAKGKLYLTTSDETSSNLYRTGLLNYAVIVDDNVYQSGNITSSGEIEIDLGTLIKSDSATTSYSIYVWLDNDLIENSDYNSVYSGSIRAEAIQFNNK